MEASARLCSSATDMAASSPNCNSPPARVLPMVAAGTPAACAAASKASVSSVATTVMISILRLLKQTTMPIVMEYKQTTIATIRMQPERRPSQKIQNATIFISLQTMLRFSVQKPVLETAVMWMGFCIRKRIALRFQTRLTMSCPRVVQVELQIWAFCSTETLPSTKTSVLGT